MKLKIYIQATLVFISCILSGNSFANQKLTIVASFHKPPYLIKKNNEITGFEVELVSSVLSNLGYETNFILVPFTRSMELLEEPNVNGIMTVSEEIFSDTSKLSKPFITYQNIAASLVSETVEISSIKDLGKYSMATFQLAPKLLGKEFELASAKSPYLIEISEQVRQLNMLERNKVQLVVMDKNILNYFNRQTKLDLTIHSVFPKNYYGLALDDSDLVEKFDIEMDKFKKSKAYQTLLVKYKMFVD